MSFAVDDLVEIVGASASRVEFVDPESFTSFYPPRSEALVYSELLSGARGRVIHLFSYAHQYQRSIVVALREGWPRALSPVLIAPAVGLRLLTPVDLLAEIG